MKSDIKHLVRTLIGSVCLLLPLLLLAACGGAGATTATPTPTPKPTPSPTPTPNPAIAQTLTGDGYTIGYPQNWTESHQAPLALFIDQTSGASLSIVAAADDGSSLNTVIDSTIQGLGATLTNVQKGQSSTTTIDGEAWQKQEYTGEKSGAQIKGFVLVTKHSGKIFAISAAVSADKYDTVNTQYIQYMLQSFKFSS